MPSLIPNCPPLTAISAPFQHSLAYHSRHPILLLIATRSCTFPPQNLLCMVAFLRPPAKPTEAASQIPNTTNTHLPVSALPPDLHPRLLPSTMAVPPCSPHHRCRHHGDANTPLACVAIPCTAPGSLPMHCFLFIFKARRACEIKPLTSLTGI